MALYEYGVLSVVKSGKESEFEWKIENFSLYKILYRSPNFKFEGESWCLYLDPNNDSNRYMYLSLYRYSSGSAIEVEFSVSLKNKKGRKRIERRERHCFEGHKDFTVSFPHYDIKQWIHTTEFSNRQREFLSSGCLTIILTMKRVDSESESESEWETESDTDSVAIECSFCKESLHEDKIAFHIKCLDKLAKCPGCKELVGLQKWFDHECKDANMKGENGALQPSGLHPKDKIAQDFKKLLFNQENCDVVLKVQGREFSAHQTILTARSPVFASTFRCNMKEKETGTVDIEDIDPSCFPEFLCYLYCGEIDKLSAENVGSIFIAADKYQIIDLRRMCLEFMQRNLCVNTFCETLVLALLHTETELINSCTDYFVRNAEEIVETVQWQNFNAENPTQGNELFIKYIKSTKKSNK